MVKVLVWAISAINLWLGLRAALNAVGVLQTSKYSQTTTILFALLFLGFGAAGFYATILRNDLRVGLLVSVGPWVLAAVILFVSMTTSRYP
jgi:hypothetical protein